MTPCSATRGNCKKLFKSRPRLDIRKYSFSHRVVDIWNSLSDSVINAGTLNTFENRLDSSGGHRTFYIIVKRQLQPEAAKTKKSWCQRWTASTRIRLR